jgi:hypothetical protein
VSVKIFVPRRNSKTSRRIDMNKKVPIQTIESEAGGHKAFPASLVGAKALQFTASALSERYKFALPESFAPAALCALGNLGGRHE